MTCVPFGYILFLIESTTKAFRVPLDATNGKGHKDIVFVACRLVHLPGLEPGTTVPKTGMISVSLQVQHLSIVAIERMQCTTV